ncbi:hypothetical protein PEC106664_15130 [Pectobacterium carotovorum subsp. carotovorum]|nr:hypothetical protein PEC106664_15130 [Pectobacterium carotovorum subsp. carotovorum]
MLLGRIYVGYEKFLLLLYVGKIFRFQHYRGMKSSIFPEIFILIPLRYMRTYHYLLILTLGLNFLFKNMHPKLLLKCYVLLYMMHLLWDMKCLMSYLMHYVN